MLWSETAVREIIRNRDGKRVFFLGKGDQLTSAARDYLSRERIEIRPADQAKPERYRLLSGGFLEEKPEHMTHLRGDILVPKTHPRIAFRGALDSLQAEIMLCKLKMPAEIASQIEELLAFSRHLLSSEVMEEPVSLSGLCGLTDKEIRERSHRPQDFYGQPHFMPSTGDGEQILLLNRCRCMARQAELRAVEAFTGEDGRVEREDLLRGLNRMSSMLYILMIQLKSRDK